MKGRLGRAHDKIKMKSIGTSEAMCFEKMMDVGADLRFVTANVEYCMTTLGWKKSKDHTYGKIMMEAK